ncbi:MAG TPA: efflux RND transporter periplasmic adaptor subunit [Thermoanaerobaculia bacterium]
MKKRMILMLVGATVFIGAIGAVKARQVRAAIAQHASFQPPPEAVTTIVARQEQWPATLSAIGTVAAVHGVTVSADLPGIVSKISFESGKTVRAGDLLVQLDTKQEEAQLAAAEAQRELSRLNLDRMRNLSMKGVTATADYDRADAEHKQAVARVGEIRATIARKTIRAPFSGILGIRQVNLGQYLTGGGAIVPLQSLDPIYVNFSVPQQQVGRLGPGNEVRVETDGAGTELTGKLTATDSVIDEATRNIQVQATLANPEGKLRPGMFVEAKVGLGTASAVVALPASAINYAPYGDSVFVVENLKSPKGQTYKGVRQQFVKLGGGRGDQIAVLSGVKPGEEIVTSGIFKLRNGAAVQVNNKTQPGNNPAPKPEDS